MNESVSTDGKGGKLEPEREIKQMEVRTNIHHSGVKSILLPSALPKGKKYLNVSYFYHPTFFNNMFNFRIKPIQARGCPSLLMFPLFNFSFANEK